ncbi:hypothetical protein L596_014950 [Steinernema carpocapsae]|nr:hypothetical protein L596_014950 [Steinernema carpocapsae]
MMSDLEIQPMGRLHCGIDDVRNTCQVVTKLLGKPEGWDTAVFQLTSTLNGRYPGYVPGTVLEVQDKTGRRTQAPTLPIRKTTALLKRNRYSAPELSPQFIPYESSQFYSYLLNFAGSA